MERTSTIRDFSTLALRAKNLSASIMLTVIGCAIYAIAPYNDSQLGALYGWVGFSFTGREFLFKAAALYGALLAVCFLTERSPGISKSLSFVRIVARFVGSPRTASRSGLSRDDRTAVLVTVLKIF